MLSHFRYVWCELFEAPVPGCCRCVYIMDTGHPVTRAYWLLSAVAGTTDALVFTSMVSVWPLRVSCHGDTSLKPPVLQHVAL